MMSRTKIKISDNEDLRGRLDAEYESHTQIQLCRYAILLAKHILTIVNCEDRENTIIQAGFDVNEKWQQGKATMYEVRQAGFAIHRAAKANKDAVMQTALRVVGQAVATGHMKEHAMVASDYAVKVVNILYPNNAAAVNRERIWQIECLQSV